MYKYKGVLAVTYYCYTYLSQFYWCNVLITQTSLIQKKNFQLKKVHQIVEYVILFYFSLFAKHCKFYAFFKCYYYRYKYCISCSWSHILLFFRKKSPQIKILDNYHSIHDLYFLLLINQFGVELPLFQ